MSDEINNPKHYISHPSGVEAIDLVEALDDSFGVGNAVKYLYRAGQKEGQSELKDLKKAKWYLQRSLGRAILAFDRSNDVVTRFLERDDKSSLGEVVERLRANTLGWQITIQDCLEIVSRRIEALESEK